MPAVNTIQLRRDTAANWTSVNPTLAIGELGFETNTRLIKAGNGANNWSTLPYLGLTPAGVISQFAGSAAPSGYLLCEGQSVSTTTFADLFAVIGYTYGGSGANFTVPNLKGRIPVGLDATQTEFDALGEAGGAKAVALSASELPAHSHPNTLSSNTVASSGHTHSHASPVGLNSGSIHVLGPNNPALSNVGLGAYTGAVSVQTASPVVNIGGGNTGFEVWRVESSGPSGNTTVGINNANNTGGGGAHNNLQPYIVVNYIIKT
jgi:microcystin-dependent protein